MKGIGTVAVRQTIDQTYFYGTRIHGYSIGLINNTRVEQVGKGASEARPRRVLLNNTKSDSVGGLSGLSTQQRIFVKTSPCGVSILVKGTALILFARRGLRGFGHFRVRRKLRLHTLKAGDGFFVSTLSRSPSGSAGVPASGLR